MATTYIKPLHRRGGISAALGDSLSYVDNKRKTTGNLVEGYECNPQTAQAEFLLSKQIYASNTGRDQGERDVIAYHIRMSFKPGSVTPEKALELGRELAMRWTRGKHQFVIAAHINTRNPHVHIIYNSVTLDCDRKYDDFLHSYKALRRVSDQICLEHGLAIIEKPGPSKGFNRTEYLQERDGKGNDDSAKPLSVRDSLREIIDAQLAQIISSQETQHAAILFEKFLAAMKSAGCEVKRGKHLAFKIPGGQRFIRCKSLGEDYEETALLERLASVRKVVTTEAEILPQENYTPSEISPKLFPPLQDEEESETNIHPCRKSSPAQPQTQPTSSPTIPPTLQPCKPNLLIDIQAKLQQAHSPGFEHFARLYNIKEMAKTLIFLSERKLENYDALVEKGNEVSVAHNKRATRVKEIESRLKEISELQKWIGTYGKTKDTFLTWRQLQREEQSAWDKLRNKEHPAENFHETNRANITLHESAKKYFDAQGYGRGTGKKIPTIKSLQTEYAKLNAEKKKLWSSYKSEREEMIALKLAKQNCDIFLGEPREPQATKIYEYSL
jgi:hypothetical protein